MHNTHHIFSAPSSVQVEDQTYFGFTLTFDRIRDVAHYEVSYKAQHDRESYGSLFTATNVCRVSFRKNIVGNVLPVTHERVFFISLTKLDVSIKH